MKVISKELVESSKISSDLMKNEIQVLEGICHPNIVRLFEILEDDNNYYIVSELMKYGELYDYARKRNKPNSDEGWIEEEGIQIIAQEILLALNFMHLQNLAHRDLKPQNIMMEDLETLEIKLTDFGFASAVDTNHKLNQ